MLGVTDPLLGVSGSNIILHTGAPSLDVVGTYAYLLATVLLLLMGTLITFRGTIERERASRIANILHAWKLRQLVPTTAPAS